MADYRPTIQQLIKALEDSSAEFDMKTDFQGTWYTETISYVDSNRLTEQLKLIEIDNDLYE